MENIGKDGMKKLFVELCEDRSVQEILKENNLGGYFDIGEEAVTVGSLAAMQDDDFVNVYFRGDAAVLRLKGAVTLEDQVAWWLRRKGSTNPITNVVPTGWLDPSRGLIGTTSSCLGGDVDVCCGVALAQKLQKTGRVMVLLIGEGATGKGNFHESLNFASILKMPFVIVVRENGWAMSSPKEDCIAAEHVSQMANSYNIPSVITDGNDVLSVRKEVEKALEWARAGKGPYMVEAKTYRMGGHSIRDEDDYRSIEILNEWKKKDPLLKMEKQMLENGFSAAEIEEIRNKVRKAVSDAYARAQTLPQQEIDEVLETHQAVVNRMWGRG